MTEHIESSLHGFADQVVDPDVESNGRLAACASPLVSYGLAGLRRCWMPGQNRWSYKYHLDGRLDPNQSRPQSDLYYSLNVLLGLAPIRAAVEHESYDVSAVFGSICEALPHYAVRNGAWGMALWAAAELRLDVPEIAANRLRTATKDISSLAGWTAQDVGLTLSGVTAQLCHDASWRPLAQGLRDLLMAHFRGPGALFRDSGKGARRYFATFATQIYAALSLYQFAEAVGDAAALAAANACAEKLIELQGAHGEWPWFYQPNKDRVLDRYEVYSVHQHGMAPALLHHAVRHGVSGARAAIERGFEWVFGKNELGVSMLVPALQLIYRSQARSGLQGRRIGRILGSAVKAAVKSDWPILKPELRLTPEMRSYEFGWLLWSFGDRADYPSLTHHSGFADALAWSQQLGDRRSQEK